MKLFKIVLLMFLLLQAACTTQQTQIVPFNPDMPVEVRRPLFRPGMYQQGEVFETSEMTQYLKQNKEVQSKLSWGRFYFFSGLLLSGVAGGMFVTAEDAAEAFTAIGAGMIGFGLSRYGTSYYLDIGDIHNRSFKRIRKPIESSIGVGILPVAGSGKAAPGLVFSTDL